MSDKINIFGKVNQALSAAADGDGKTFIFTDVDDNEARALAILLTTAYCSAVRIMLRSSLSENDINFLREMHKFNEQTKGKISDFATYVQYDSAARTVRISLPAERVLDTQERLRDMHSYIFDVQQSQIARVNLREYNQGTPKCYTYGLVDTTNTIGPKAIAQQMFGCLEAIAVAHGYENAVFTSLEERHPTVIVKTTALDAMARMEKLELLRSRDSGGDFPSH